MLEFFIGVIAGTCTGLGLGGGSVLILLLSLFLNFEQHVAQATNLIFFIPAALISIILNIKNKNINLKNAIPIVIFGIIGSIIGSKISYNLNVSTLRKCFGLFLFFIAIYEIFSFYKLYIKDKKSHNIFNLF